MIRQLALTVVTVHITIIGFAHGEQSDAEHSFQEGRQLVADGNFEAACRAFAKSHQLEPGIGVLLNLADCHARLGEHALAYREFARVQALALAAKRTAFADEARKRMNELAPEVAMVTVLFEGPRPKQLAVVVGDVDVTPDLGKPVAIEPGAAMLRRRLSRPCADDDASHSRQGRCPDRFAAASAQARQHHASATWWRHAQSE